ncbi:hypothetical protein ACWC9H_27370 [Streptomyces sp. NPDC001251]
MADPLDELEREAAARSRRSAGTSRNAVSPEERAARQRAAREAREAQAAKRDAERRARAQRPVEDQEQGAGPAQAEADEPRTPRPKKARPTSIPFYPESDNEEFLWRVQEAATARREKIPATAVLRLALRRLEQQMTPGDIVRELGGPVQTTGKMGRPRR